MGEQARIDRLITLFGAAGGDRVPIGDDAAVLADGLVLSVDAMVEGRHFRRGWLSPEQLGARATVAALSDLAAMGASARAVLAHVTLSNDLDDAWLEGLAAGQRAAASAVGARVVGGNLSGGDAIAIATTVVGDAEQPLTRGGGRRGDRLWAVGPLGHARAGLLSLMGDGQLDEAITAWREPTARVSAGRAAVGRATAAIDLSDGLVVDAGRLARASGCGFALDATVLDDAKVVDWAKQLGTTPEDLVLEGGEDYALLLAAPPEEDLGDLGRPVGRLVEAGEWLGKAPLAAMGFDHFER